MNTVLKGYQQCGSSAKHLVKDDRHHWNLGSSEARRVGHGENLPCQGSRDAYACQNVRHEQQYVKTPATGTGKTRAMGWGGRVHVPPLSCDSINTRVYG